MEITHKDFYNGLWDCPESFHMDAETHKVFEKNLDETLSLAIFGPQIDFGAKVPRAFWRCFQVGSIYNCIFAPSLIWGQFCHDSMTHPKTQNLNQPGLNLSLYDVIHGL